MTDNISHYCITLNKGFTFKVKDETQSLKTSVSVQLNGPVVFKNGPDNYFVITDFSKQLDLEDLKFAEYRDSFNLILWSYEKMSNKKEIQIDRSLIESYIKSGLDISIDFTLNTRVNLYACSNKCKFMRWSWDMESVRFKGTIVNGEHFSTMGCVELMRPCELYEAITSINKHHLEIIHKLRKDIDYRLFAHYDKIITHEEILTREPESKANIIRITYGAGTTIKFKNQALEWKVLNESFDLTVTKGIYNVCDNIYVSPDDNLDDYPAFETTTNLHLESKSESGSINELINFRFDNGGILKIDADNVECRANRDISIWQKYGDRDTLYFVGKCKNYIKRRAISDKISDLDQLLILSRTTNAQSISELTFVE